MNVLGIVKRPQLGGDVDDYCSKCKEIREHVIAVLNSQGEIVKVQCRTCGSNHIYRKKQVKATPTRTTKSGTTRKSSATPVGDGPLRPFSIKDKYSVGDRIDHSKFGLGVVVDVRLTKIDVKFGKELKVLIHCS